MRPFGSSTYPRPSAREDSDAVEPVQDATEPAATYEQRRQTIRALRRRNLTIPQDTPGVLTPEQLKRNQERTSGSY